MKDLIYSEITHLYYSTNDSVRITDINQARYYVKKGVLLYDMYISQDENNKDVWVWLFNKKSSYKYYQNWRNKTLD